AAAVALEFDVQLIWQGYATLQCAVAGDRCVIFVANFAASFQVGRYGLGVAGRPSRTACRDGGPVSPAVGPVLPREHRIGPPVLPTRCPDNTWSPSKKVRRCAPEHRAGIPDGLHSLMPLQARPDLAGWVACPDAGPWGARLDTSRPKAYFSGTDEVSLDLR